MVKDFENPEGATWVRWTGAAGQVEKKYRSPAYAVVLTSLSGVLIVEPLGHPDNCVIYNEDGTERVRLANPMAGTVMSAFVDAYYVQGELTVILGYRGGQTACVFDDAGKILRVYETR